MNEDGDETQPTSSSRQTLAASTLRALRAGRTPSSPATDGPPGDGSADVPAPAEASDVELEAPGAQPEFGTLLKKWADEPVVDAEPVPDVEPVADAKPRVDAERADDAEPTADATDQRRGSSVLTVACVALAVAALVFAVVAGVVWWTAGHSGQSRLGVARDQVSKDAQLAITTVNTSDYRKPAAALSNWLEVSTGSLHSQFSQSRTAAIKLLSEAKTVTKASVLDEAVTSVNTTKGSASVIASVNVTRVRSGSTSTVRNRFRATLTKVGGQWKLSNLTVVSVSLS